MSGWPSVVWSAPALRDLDGRARAEIAAAGALRNVRALQPAYRDGDLAEAFFAVVDGIIEVRGAAGRVLREARAGETFGEEAFVGASVLRRGDAIAVRRATVAAIPGALLRRVLERGASRSAARVERVMRRAAARERLRSSALARGCSDAGLDLLLDAIEHVHLARGEALFRVGDVGDRAFVVASGLVKLERAAGAAAHLGAGDVFGEEDVLAQRGRTYAAIASGPSWLLAIPADVTREARALAPRAFEAARDARGERFAAGARATEAAGAGRSVLVDLHRFQVARSLVLIDEVSCVQCGHCAWSCASAHEDGVSRLVRRGEIVHARVEEDGAARAILLATSCQHCESAACMPACPTGAIAHGARGEVVLREDLCTGCGACAKACPWDAVKMAPRAGGGSVAVKCDLCAGTTTGPACVEGCPTGALVRVEPRAAISDARVALGADARPAVVTPRPLPAWPFVALGIVLGGLALNGPASKGASGAIAGAALALLAGYGAWKRLARRSGRLAYVTHLAVAPVALAATAHHAGGHLPSDASGALAVAMIVALVTGLAGALAYAVLPPLLARLAERGALPEDFAARAKELEARGFSELTGKSERVKAIFAHLIRPYAHARWGALTLLVRGGDTRAEVARLSGRIARVLAGRTIPREELEPLVRTAVEARAVRAEAWLHAALRGWLPAHVVAAAVAVALLVAHVVLVAVFR